MNARTQIFEMALEGRQVEEAVSSLFHTLLFHRTLGKFHYKQEGNYCVGTVGYEDVDCDFIDLTYVFHTGYMINKMFVMQNNSLVATGSLQFGGNRQTGPQRSICV